MASRKYDVVFVGGGLAALLLLNEMRPALSRRVAVIDPCPPSEPLLVHWSYWSHRQTFYDQFSIGVWRRAKVADKKPEFIAPFTMRLVRSNDVFEHLDASLKSSSVEWIRAAARSVSRRGDGLYEVVTDAGAIDARWVFDSACDVAPTFPSPNEPNAVLSGTGVRVTADRPVFDAGTATMFDPLDEQSFAYLLPLSSSEALLESASFGLKSRKEDPAVLLRHLRSRHPGSHFVVTHVESGSIPLGFAPARTTGPRHVLIGTKRGLVKPSAGYGIVRIAEESELLARLWREHRPLPPSRRSPWRWRLLDKGFLQLAAKDPRRPLALLHHVMHGITLNRSLQLIDEQLSMQQLIPVLTAALPAMLRSP
ncbi:MAG: lycopene cyclase family protein [Rubrobacteraceae bacterium]